LFYEVLWKECHSQISIVKIYVHLFPGDHENLAMNGGSRTWRGLQGEPFNQLNCELGEAGKSVRQLVHSVPPGT